MRAFLNWEDFSGRQRYGAFSIGVTQREKPVASIRAQAEHHQRISFSNESKKFLATHGLQEEEK
jgi:hypothetical protein